MMLCYKLAFDKSGFCGKCDYSASRRNSYVGTCHIVETTQKNKKGCLCHKWKLWQNGYTSANCDNFYFYVSHKSS